MEWTPVVPINVEWTVHMLPQHAHANNLFGHINVNVHGYVWGEIIFLHVFF